MFVVFLRHRLYIVLEPALPLSQLVTRVAEDFVGCSCSLSAVRKWEILLRMQFTFEQKLSISSGVGGNFDIYKK